MYTRLKSPEVVICVTQTLFKPVFSTGITSFRSSSRVEHITSPGLFLFAVYFFLYCVRLCQSVLKVHILLNYNELNDHNFR